MTTQKEIIEQLSGLTSTYSFRYVIAKICFRDFCGTIDELTHKDVHNHLNSNELAFLAGLWLKNVNVNREEDLKGVDTAFKDTYRMMRELHKTFISEGPKFDITNPPDFHEVFMNSNIFKEVIFYAGTGAYDYQYIRWVVEKYKLDRGWLKANKGIELALVPEFYAYIKDTLHEKLNARNKDVHPSDEEILEFFCIDRKELLKKNSAFGPILDALTIQVGTVTNIGFNGIGDHNIFQEKPIIELFNGKLFIPQPYNVSEALYESPFYWMNGDKDYVSTALKNRGDVAEDITTQIIKKVYGEKNVYTALKIFQAKGKAATDIDVLAVHEDTAIIFQVKSKKLTALSKQGNLEALKRDFNQAVLSAFEQGMKAKECILNPNGLKFISKEGQEVFFRKNINQCEVVTVVLDTYPAIIHQSRIILEKELNEELPVSMSIFDLEVIGKYLKKPSQFFDYIHRRRKFSNYFMGDNEMCFLGFHLQRGLEKQQGADFMYLDQTWAQFIDRIYYPVVSGLEHQMKEKIGRNAPCPCGSGIKYKRCCGKPN